MKLYRVCCGDDYGYMVSPVGAIAEILASSREEAAAKLGLQLVEGSTRRVIPLPSFTSTPNYVEATSFFSDYPDDPQNLANSLVLIEEE